ncbi:MAG: O-antigen ligase [Terriglobia bacterium]
MLKQIEKIFTVAMLFYCTVNLLPFIAGDMGDFPRPEGNLLEFTVQAAFHVVAFCFIVLHWRTVLRGAWKARWILLLVAVAIASTVWSQHPLVTIRRSVLMLSTTAFGIYFGSRFTVPQQLRLLGWTCALVVLTSIFMAIFLPHYGVDHLLFPGAWRGAFTHKNILGRAMAFSMLVFYFARPPAGWWVRWVGIAGALCLLVLSRSATGIFVTAIMVATLPLYRLFRSKLTVAIPIIIVVGLAAVGSGFLLYPILPSLFELLHRGPTLTGRIELWHAMLLSIAKRPWLGYGFSAFWRAEGGSSAVIEQVNWRVLGGHNGLLDIAIDMGILGLSIFVAGYVVQLRGALRLLRKTTGEVPIWLWTYLTFMLLYSLTESTIFHQNNIFWILYTSTAVCISLHAPAPSGHRHHLPMQTDYLEQLGAAC